MRVLTAQSAGAGAERFVSEHLMAEPVERSDAVLVRRSQAGDTRAFGELVERYMRRAYYGALGLVGSPDDAMDLSQEAFARAFRFRDKLDPDRPFYAWLYQILRRLCFSRQIWRIQLIIKIMPNLIWNNIHKHYFFNNRQVINQIKSRIRKINQLLVSNIGKF